MPFKDKEKMREYQKLRYEQLIKFKDFNQTTLDKLLSRLVKYYYDDINEKASKNPSIGDIFENEAIPLLGCINNNMTPYEKALYYQKLFYFMDNHPELCKLNFR
jgi:hypothetical protein